MPENKTTSTKTVTTPKTTTATSHNTAEWLEKRAVAQEATREQKIPATNPSKFITEGKKM